jgi:hypothetical protein
MLNAYLSKPAPKIDPKTIKGYVVPIPNGYAWCMECSALTPHIEDKYGKACMVCEMSLSGIDACPNCEWSAEEILSDPTVNHVQIHHPGCHCSYESDESENDVFPESYSHAHDIALGFYKENDISFHFIHPLNKRNVACGCPEVTIYTGLNILSHWESPGHGMDCYNHLEWGGTIRCPICGCIFEYSDSNC